MQISTRKRDYIVDTIALKSELGDALRGIFDNPKITKVLHGADNDVFWLQRDFGIYIVNMFDTHQAAIALEFRRRGLAYLLENYCDLYVDKQYQLSDWTQRPLSNEMLKYAREDTHYLLYIYDKMRMELKQYGAYREPSNP